MAKHGTPHCHIQVAPLPASVSPTISTGHHFPDGHMLRTWRMLVLRPALPQLEAEARHLCKSFLLDEDDDTVFCMQ